MSRLKRLAGKCTALSDRLSPTADAWRGAALAIAMLGALIVLAYFAIYILQDFAAEKLPAFFTMLLTAVAPGIGLIFLAWLILRLPRAYRWTALLVAPVLIPSFLTGGDLQTAVTAAVILLLVSLVGGSIGLFRAEGFRPKERKLATACLVVGAGGILVGLVYIFMPKPPVNPELEDYVLEDRTLSLPNPGLPGAYEVLTLTYGSGNDRQRPEYGGDVDIVSRSVDGSKLIDNWDGMSGSLRSSYWGFDVSELPLQARVWYPDGEGPFPLVLIVHGNHSMEDYSDPGYDYLGELFASRGVILASVDENFINSSVSARIDVLQDRPGLKEENDARGWLLLQHLALWRDWSTDRENPFFEQVDIDRVALIGHSRGGEAVGIAAAFNFLERYPDDSTLEFDFDFNLRGVIAIAPVYGQYEPRERPTPIRDVNYFTIHGDMDGDVQSFEGLAQYSRVGFSGASYRFRSSLYVVGANHGQFNTTWENLDTSLYRAWALDLGRIMDREAQRDVARVYFGAFMEIVLNDRDEYLPIFRDARYAAGWLPDTFYINGFSDSNESVLANFDEDIDTTTLTAGGRIETSNLTRWFETGNELKYDELETHGLVAAWDDRASDGTARIDFLLEAPLMGNTLIASISAYDVSTLPSDFDADELAADTERR